MRKSLPVMHISRRRAIIAGTATAGAAVAAASLPLNREADPTSARRRAGEEARGYRLTEHILRYYRTAKV